ncbi:hypothetical protein NQU17_04605 [Clostridiaceae bacterium HFYG-1003]|nr:hypothetical protein NQU17_04605 [Clostridiaceae bacterium HFYG-1003]
MNETKPILIMVPTNIKYAPYYMNYINTLNRLNVPYVTISWNKGGLQEEVDEALNFTVEDTEKVRKLWGYLIFAKMCKKYIRKNKLEKLIVLTAAPSFFLGIVFLKKYRFLLDIRDDSPFIRLFPNYFKKICSAAENVIVSSPKFNAWTGRTNILCHNADVHQIMKYIDDLPSGRFQSPCRIVSAGMLAEPNINIKLLEALNREKFHLSYIGKENEEKRYLKNYVFENKCNNITFKGAYNKSDIVEIYRTSADIVNIIRRRMEINKNALPNKLYDSVIAGIPFIVLKHNEAIAEWADEFYIGMTISEEDFYTINLVLEEKIKLFDFELYSKGRRKFLHKVLADMKTFEDCIQVFSRLKRV